jgi:O-antigen/teichoic acid export membrane protein
MGAADESGRRKASRRDKWYGMSRIGINAAARMGFGVALARLAGTEVFALYVGLLTVEVVATTLCGAGWVTPIGNLAPRLPAGPREAFVRAAVLRTLRAIAVGGLVGAAALPAAVALGGLEPATWLAFCAGTAAWLASTACAAAWATGFRSLRGLLGQGFGHLVTAGGLALVATIGADPLRTFFVAAALGHGLGAAWMFVGLPRGDRLDPGWRREFARHGRVVLGGSVANTLCTRVQPFVLAIVGGAGAVAMFGAANTLVGPARVFAGAIGEVLRPRLALHQGVAGDPQRGRRALRLALGLLGGLGLGMLGLAVLAGEEVAVLVFGADFAGLGRVLPAAALFVLAAATVHVLVVALQTHSSAGAAVATRARVVAAIAALLAVWPACALDGARGAFVAMTGAELLFVLVALPSLLAIRAPRPALEALTGSGTT